MTLGVMQRLAVSVLAQGQVPAHIGIIMDGNRRYARQRDMPSYAGHKDGGDKLIECVEWCAALGVQALTVYAFSIENFKRPKVEVDTIMELADNKIRDLLDNMDVIERHSLQIRVLGNVHMLPDALQQRIRDAVDATRQNSGPVLSICFAYTGRDDIAFAMRSLARSNVPAESITPELFDSHLYTRGLPPLALLLRTSGETRLSDFLLWQVQSSGCLLKFAEVLWPEMSFRHFCALIAQYQYDSMRLAHAAPSLHS